jgi:acetyltransferase-like isoleucine patch superfamily enzyme
VKIGKYASIGLGVIIGGSSQIGENCRIWMGAAIFDRLHIGDWTVIGAGSLATTDIPQGVVAYGVPAKIVRENDEMDIERYKSKRSIH